MEGESDFTAVLCRCGAVLFDHVGFSGIERVTCRGCKKRVWVTGDGSGRVDIAMVDPRPKRILAA